MFSDNDPQKLAYMIFMTGFVTGFVFSLVVFLW
jgi:hypothetical protein